MSNFRIKKTPKTQHNIKDSNTLEIKHRQKVKQVLKAVNVVAYVKTVNTILNAATVTYKTKE